MLIDWFTVAAQVVNFLILVWLMKRFLYKPVLSAIETREKRIATELADAKSKKAEAKKDRDEFQQKNEEFDAKRAALLSRATEEAKVERTRLFEEARTAAEAMTAAKKEALISEAANLNSAIYRRTQQEVFAITRKALTDLASASLEQRIAEVFIQRINTLDEKAKTSLADALKSTSVQPLVRSAFDLPEEHQGAIQKALNETFLADTHIRFETKPDVISGIELTASGQKVAWSISEYLASLKQGVDEILDQGKGNREEGKGNEDKGPGTEDKGQGSKAERKPSPDRRNSKNEPAHKVVHKSLPHPVGSNSK